VRDIQDTIKTFAGVYDFQAFHKLKGTEPIDAIHT
jgi:hypothetical protein